MLAFHMFHAEENPYPYLGHLPAVSRRHAPGFEDLDDPEAAAVGIAVRRLTGALRSVGATHVYVARIGTGVPHLHLHLVPRWPETPDDILWHQVDESEGARRAGPEEIAAFAAQLDVELAK